MLLPIKVLIAVGAILVFFVFVRILATSKRSQKRLAPKPARRLERRLVQRRMTTQRRTSVRLEMDSDRRHGKGRRSGDHWDVADPRF
jgi:Flp pilus assembly protein TadB